VKDLSDAVALAGGEGHSLALDSTGKVWAWGANSHGQLGNGTRSRSSVPVQVKNLTDVVAIAAGGYYGLASDSSGRVWTWGGNGDGQLGDGTTNDSLVPVQVRNLGRVVAVAVAESASLALDSDGHVWTWGQGRQVPIQVEYLGDIDYIMAIVKGGNSSLVLYLADMIAFGLLGDLNGLVAGAHAGAHGLALESSGKVWSWGVNESGELGDGTTYLRYGGPVLVSGISDAVAIAAGTRHSLAILKR
jgi:alpha-tubulin suppressor-like RCC1 family protein